MEEGRPIGRQCSIPGEYEVVMNRVYGSEAGERQLAVREIREGEAARPGD